MSDRRKDSPVPLPSPDLAENKDPLDTVPPLKLNPWVALLLLFLAILAYILVWMKLLGGSLGRL